MMVTNNPVLCFDGDCNLCNGFVQWVIKNDPKQCIKFASLQSVFIRNAMKHLLSFILLLSLSSCGAVLKLAYGIKQPTPTSDEEVLRYAAALFEGEHVIYRPQSDTALATLMNDYKIGLPGILFFNHEGQGININEDLVNTCTASADQLITQLSTLENLPKKEYVKSEFTQLIQPLGLQRKTASNSADDFEYSIIVFWADFAGKKLNNEKTKVWVRTYQELSTEFKQKIDFIIVNVDFLKAT